MKKLREQLPEVTFIYDFDAPSDHLLTICGCTRECVRPEEKGPGVSVMHKIEDLDRVREEIEETLKKIDPPTA